MRKWSNGVFVVAFLCLLALPLIGFNFAPDQVSQIDNTRLEEFPDFQAAGLRASLSQIKEYFSQRLGFRSEAITLYQRLNDRVYGLLVHPLYEYGRDKEVFFGFGYEMENFRYLSAYTTFVGRMEAYLSQRDIPFYYVLNPTKPMLYPEGVAQGVNYRYLQYQTLLADLDALNVQVIDLAPPLTAAKEKGRVYHFKYDPGHWSDFGAFTGVSAMLARIGADFPAVQGPARSDYQAGVQVVTSLPVSYFPIYEELSTLTPLAMESVETAGYDKELRVSPIFPSAKRYHNPQRPDAPRALILHGSHFAEAPRFVADAFSEALFVYSYGTVFDLPYYVSLFQPDLVIYEVAAQVITDADYFRYDLLVDTVFPPAPASFSGVPESSGGEAVETGASIKARAEAKHGRELLTLTYSVADLPTYAYLLLEGKALDMEVAASDDGGALLSLTLEAAALQGAEGAEILCIEAGSSRRTIVPVQF